MNEIVRLHGVPIFIISDRGSQFTSRFWRFFQEALVTRVDLSTAFHPQTDGQSERTIQILEDMLRACILDFGGSWDAYLPLAEFAYNNSFQSNIQMAPYKALYGRRCCSPIGWFEVGEANVLGLDLVQEAMDKVQLIRQRLLTAQRRQESYADKRRRYLVFTVGDKVFLQVSPMKGVMRFDKRGKFSLRYIGPYEILDWVGGVAYRLAPSPDMSFIHPVFHVSMLRKYISDSSYVLEALTIPIDENLRYEEEPVAIVDKQDRPKNKGNSVRFSVEFCFCCVYWPTLSFTLKWDFSLVPPSASSHSRCAFPAPPSTDFRFLSSQLSFILDVLSLLLHPLISGNTSFGFVVMCPKSVQLDSVN
ncbi:hypothetical protein MTR67_007209 [Solanum verrucosum]|uniref:Integrase catalytic domain-containing protein n=1 Tax=Solanum verrucosum TaxID=315347 RepID=A0AAF0TCW3_SOLVR|nr:hypothetical protein MTR67_007209 [Solanum verrucosum]